MRKLYCIPIIHDEADLGDAGATLGQRSAALAGEAQWRLHQEVLAGFWEAIRAFLLSLDARRLKVYQDGQAAGGELGRRVVEEAARRGSRNYRLVLELLQRGAELRRTEEAALLLETHESVRRSLQRREGTDVGRERLRQARLTEARDRSIAAAINSTLKDGEVGVLFIGADHNVPAHLPADIMVVALKDRHRVLAYFAGLLQGSDDEKLKEMARYLTSAVQLPG
ncbi:MAG: hypothetical protein HY683_00360 [Chloroflexi bacterium]|nr:hypothetical protein [Chloroflexota bacterium]